MKNRLRRSEREAVKNKYASTELLYKVMSKGAREVEKQMAHFRFTVEELFLEVMTIMDAVKEDAENAYDVYADYWDTLYCDLRDLDTANSDEEELRIATSEVVYMAILLLSMCKGRYYAKLSASLMEQIVACHPETFDKLSKLFMPEVWRLDEVKVKVRVQAYMDSEEWISDDIAEMLESLPVENKSSGEENISEITGNNPQLTNRQLVILFEHLLDVSLIPGFTNIQAFSQLLGAVSGRSPASIRQVAMKEIDYASNSVQADINRVEGLVRPVSEKIANQLSKIKE